jgi:para-aminobenzoate synthetase
MKTLLIDNYDSYTFNLFQLLAEVNRSRPLVIRNDQLRWDELLHLDIDNIVISPGPGRPEQPKDFGICERVLREMDLPILGVCLGHQGLGYAFGGRVAPAPRVMHGQLSRIRHNDGKLFEGVPQHFSAVRYHSLMVAEPLPETLEAIAWAEDDDVIMALRHRERLLLGVQFHPESVSTEYGKKLLANFAQITADFWAGSPQMREKFGRRASRSDSILPSREKAKTTSGAASLPVHSRKLDVFYEPEQVFYQLYRDEPFAFWLDSSRVEAGLSRFSFMGASTEVLHYDVRTKKLRVEKAGVETEHEESVFTYLDRVLTRKAVDSLELPFDFNGGFVGYFGYELKAECGANVKYEALLPDASFLFVERLIAFDHLEGVTYLVQVGAEDWLTTVEQALQDLPAMPVADALLPEKTPLEFHVHRQRQDYLADIQQIRDYLRAGESYEICLTTQVSTVLSLEPLNLYRHLRKINPAPYAAYLRFGENAILSSSPERFLKIDREGWVEAKPIKGTARRGATPDEDAQLRDALKNGEKTRAENLMIVDLLRNDLGMVCDVGSVHVPKLMDVETYSTVHQLVSTIRGHLRDELHVVDAIKAAFPGGSMTGAPKLRTMELIDRLEKEARGVYSGAIGFLSLSGTADLNIVIRTLVSTPEGLRMGAGGAVTILSDAAEEYDEMLLKTEALMKAIVFAAHGTFDKDLLRIQE